MRKTILVTSFLVAFCLSAKSQIILQGTVKDVTNNEPLVGAFITIKGMGGMIGVAELDGTYRVIVPTPSEARNIIVSVSHIGYIERKDIVELLPVDDGETIFQNFEMEPDPVAIKEVTVTANKVEEKLQNVPISVTAISAKDLENRTVSNTTEALETIPNLVTDAYLPNQPTFSLRGLASNFDNNGIENSVALYIDDVYYSRSFNFNSTLMDIERVEVLRGPQGTLFGKNSVGGVIHIISEEPKMGNSAAVELSAGNFNFYQARAKGNLELIEDKMAIRLAGAYKSRDGWLVDENEALEDQNGIEFGGGRLSWLYRPSNKFDIMLKGTYSRDGKASFTTDYIPSTFGNRLEVSDTIATDRRSHQNDEGIYFDREVYGGVARMTYKLDQVHTLTSVTSFNGVNTNFLKDFDVTPVDATNFTRNAEVQTVTQEIRLSTPRENRKLFYIAGLYFLQERLDTRDSIALKEPFAAVWQQQFGLPVQPIPGYFEFVSPNSIINSTSIAGFASGSAEVSESIRFNAGIRYTSETKELEYFQNVGADYDLISLAVAQVGSRDKPLIREVTDNQVSFNVGVDFQTSDQTLLFLSLSRGFKGAGFNTEFAPDSLGGTLVFRPEFINNYEVGLKMKFSGRYRLNMTAFVTDYKDKQETAPGGSAYRVANAKSAQGVGFESELAALFGSHVRLDASLGLLSLRYLDFPFSDRVGQPINLSGSRLYKAPQFTFQISPSYAANVGPDLKVRLQFDYAYVGKTYNDIYNTEALARDAAGTLNGRLEFSNRKGRFSVALWAKNITDVVYFQHAWEFNFGSHVAVNPPRTLGVELRMNFFGN